MIKRIFSSKILIIDKELAGISRINYLKGSAFQEASKKLKGKYEFMRMGKNDAFGELALINDQPRSATIVCTKDCHFAVLSKENCKFL